MNELTEDEAVVIKLSDLECNRIEEVLAILKSDKNGLSDEAAQQRLSIFGQNKIEEKNRNVSWAIGEKILKFFGFMWNPLSWVLQAAAAISIVHGNWKDCLGIIALLIINSIISLIEEENAGKTAAGLMAHFPLKAKVRRGGRWKDLDAGNVVPGDVIRIKPGVILPADVRLLEGDPVKIDRHALTGECLAATCCTGNLVPSGSTCNQGQIDALVIATGDQIFFRNHQHVLDTDKKVGQYLKVMTAVRKFSIYAVVVGITVVLTLMYAFQRRPYRAGINFLLVLLIGGIPIAMPTVLSTTMAIGIHLLSRKGAITKRMAAIENLAGMDVLCSDKTGALTLTKLQFDVLHFADGIPEKGLIRAASISFQYEDPDATDKSIYEMLDDEWKRRRAAIQELHFVPYDPTNKLAVMTYIDGAEILRVSKGAPEKILELNLIGDKSVIENSINAKMDEYAKSGLRAHAVACQKVPKGRKENRGGSWQFLGLLPINDLARPGSARSIKRALELGVTVKMITGDQLEIANHTAELLGLRTSIHPSSSLFGHSKDDVLAVLAFRNMLEKTDVFAGVTPALKYEIVKRLQSIKHICGVTGAELNDVPALEKADIGIAIFDATDAARRASDIFLTEGGLSVIVNAVLTSRAVFRRMKCYTIYAVSITTLIVLGFTLLALVWRFSFPLILVLIIAILNDVLVMAIARDSVKPSPQPDSWRLSEIFTMGVVLGCYLAGMTVLFFWTASRTDFFPRFFDTSSLQGTGQDSLRKLTSAIFLQLSIISQALVFVTRSHSWSVVDPPSLLLAAWFFASQLIATVIAVYANWSFATIMGIGWGWAGIIWLFNAVIYIFLDVIKLITRCVLTSLERLLHPTEGKVGDTSACSSNSSIRRSLQSGSDTDEVADEERKQADFSGLKDVPVPSHRIMTSTKGLLG